MDGYYVRLWQEKEVLPSPDGVSGRSSQGWERVGKEWVWRSFLGTPAFRLTLTVMSQMHVMHQLSVPCSGQHSGTYTKHSHLKLLISIGRGTDVIGTQRRRVLSQRHYRAD